MSLTETDRQYYRRISKLFDDDSGTTDEEEGFASVNVVEQVLKDGLATVCCDKEGSVTLERLIVSERLQLQQVKSLRQGVLESLEDIVMDCCGSHVLETLIKTEGCVTNGDGQGSKQDSEDESVVLQVAQFCSRNIWQCVSDVYCSHVVRTLIQSLGGVEVGGKGRQTKGARGGRVRTVCNVSDRYVKALHGLARSVRKCEQLKEMLTDVNASPVLQVLLFVLHQREPSSAVKLVSCLAKSSGLLEHSQESPDLPSLFCSTIGSHTAEVLIEVASEDLLQQVYTNSFRHRLLSLALHSKANFVLQQFLASASTEQVSMVVDELLVNVEEVMFVGHYGVLVSLVSACVHCPEKQSSVMQMLLRVFHVEQSPKQLLKVILSLTTLEVYQESKDREDFVHVNYHGSVLVQSLLRYQNPSLLSSHLLRLGEEMLLTLALHPSGSHVIEAFLGSRTVLTKHRQKLVKLFKDHWGELAVDKFGSHVLQRAWNCCELAGKKQMAKGLLEVEEQLEGNMYGKIVVAKCRLSQYRNQPGHWEERVVASQRKVTADDRCAEIEDIFQPLAKKPKI